jgi:hypothetical protein
VPGLLDKKEGRRCHLLNTKGGIFILQYPLFYQTKPALFRVVVLKSILIVEVHKFRIDFHGRI